MTITHDDDNRGRYKGKQPKYLRIFISLFPRFPFTLQKFFFRKNTKQTLARGREHALRDEVRPFVPLREKSLCFSAKQNKEIVFVISNAIWFLTKCSCSLRDKKILFRNFIFKKSLSNKKEIFTSCLFHLRNCVYCTRSNW